MQITSSLNEAVLTWTLHDAGAANALGTSFIAAFTPKLAALEQHCAQWRANPRQEGLAYRVLVITAEPAGRQRPIWIAGGNLKELASLTTRDEGGRYGAQMSDICRRLQELPIPVVMAIHGEAIGGGAEFALASDLRFMTEASRFDFKQLTIGLATGYGSSARLVSLVGASRASQLLLLRERLTAERALAWGLVHAVVKSPAELAQHCAEVARGLVGVNPLAIACQKAMLQGARRPQEAADRAHELALFTELWLNDDHRKVLSSFRPSSA